MEALEMIDWWTAEPLYGLKVNVHQKETCLLASDWALKILKSNLRKSFIIQIFL